jgi:mono/diheme cytochrome c family protein
LRIASVGIMAFAAGCVPHADDSWDWDRMRSQPRLSAYHDHAGTTAMRLPPEGTVSRESAVDDSAMQFPVDPARGKARYDTFCAVCHGARGDGESLLASNIQGMKPVSFISGTFGPERVFAAMTNGFGRMPAFAAEITARDRWQVVRYVESLQRDAHGAP